MAKFTSLKALAVLSVLVISTVAAATQGGICNMTQDELTACKPAITGPKPVPNPTDVCCTALKHADLNCLCSYKNAGWLTFLHIDSDLAMQLPAKCKMAPVNC